MLRDSRLMLVIAVSVMLCASLYHLEWFGGHEGYSYVIRTLEWAQELRAGSLYPRWCPDFYGGYGSPLFQFHGVVIYSMAGMLTATFLNAFIALKVVVFFFSIMSGVGTYALVYGETRQREAAFFGAMAYLASPYRNGNLFARGDLGEFACIALLPVVIAFYRAASREALPQRSRWLAAAGAVTHGVMIMAHPVLGLWGSLVVGFIVLSSVWWLWSIGVWRRAVPLVLAVALAPGVAATFIVPAMSYRTLTRTADMVVGFYMPTDQWLTIEQLFGNHPVFGPNFLAIGPLVATATLASVLALIVNFKKSWAVIGWMALTFALVYLMLQYAHWFWVPGRVPLSQFIQFPWRLCGPASLTASIALGIALAHSRLSESAKGALAIACTVAFIVFTSWPFLTQGQAPYNGAPQDPDSLRTGMYSATSENEYVPLTTVVPHKPRGEVVQSSDGAEVQFASSDGSHHTLGLKAERPNAEVSLGLHFFPGWTMRTLSGPAKAELKVDDKGRLKVNLPVAGEYRLRVKYGIPPAGVLGGALSLLSLLALVLLAVGRANLSLPSLPWLRTAGGTK